MKRRVPIKLEDGDAPPQESSSNGGYPPLPPTPPMYSDPVPFLDGFVDPEISVAQFVTARMRQANSPIIARYRPRACTQRVKMEMRRIQQSNISLVEALPLALGPAKRLCENGDEPAIQELFNSNTPGTSQMSNPPQLLDAPAVATAQVQVKQELREEIEDVMALPAQILASPVPTPVPSPEPTSEVSTVISAPVEVEAEVEQHVAVQAVAQASFHVQSPTLQSVFPIQVAPQATLYTPSPIPSPVPIQVQTQLHAPVQLTTRGASQLSTRPPAKRARTSFHMPLHASTHLPFVAPTFAPCLTSSYAPPVTSSVAMPFPQEQRFVSDGLFMPQMAALKGVLTVDNLLTKMTPGSVASDYSSMSTVMAMALAHGYQFPNMDPTMCFPHHPNNSL